jgi:hypothetical protein
MSHQKQGLLQKNQHTQSIVCAIKLAAGGVQRLSAVLPSRSSRPWPGIVFATCSSFTTEPVALEGHGTFSVADIVGLLFRFISESSCPCLLSRSLASCEIIGLSEAGPLVLTLLAPIIRFRGGAIDRGPDSKSDCDSVTQNLQFWSSCYTLLFSTPRACPRMYRMTAEGHARCRRLLQKLCIIPVYRRPPSLPLLPLANRP